MRTVATLLASTTLALASVASGAPLATCFNDSDPTGGRLGVWTYEGYSDWKSARAAIRTNFPGTLMFSFVPGKSEYKVSDLGYCYYMRPGNPGAPPVTCRSGALHIASVDVPRVLWGKYSFELENGERRILEFSAPYCPKGVP